jgi:hypothetical protein
MSHRGIVGGNSFDHSVNIMEEMALNDDVHLEVNAQNTGTAIFLDCS